LHDTPRLPVWPVLRLLRDGLMTELHRATSGRERSLTPSSHNPVAVLQRMCDQHLASST
jgi:hypothetical protein